MFDGLHNLCTLLTMILLIQSSKPFTVKPTTITSPASPSRDSHDVNSAMFVSPTSPVGVELFSVNAFFCLQKICIAAGHLLENALNTETRSKIGWTALYRTQASFLASSGTESRKAQRMTLFLFLPALIANLLFCW